MRVDDDDVAGSICQGLPRPIGAGGCVPTRHAPRARLVKRLNRAFSKSPQSPGEKILTGSTNLHRVSGTRATTAPGAAPHTAPMPARDTRHERAQLCAGSRAVMEGARQQTEVRRPFVILQLKSGIESVEWDDSENEANAVHPAICLTRQTGIR